MNGCGCTHKRTDTRSHTSNARHAAHMITCALNASMAWRKQCCNTRDKASFVCVPKVALMHTASWVGITGIYSKCSSQMHAERHFSNNCFKQICAAPITQTYPDAISYSQAHHLFISNGNCCAVQPACHQLVYQPQHRPHRACRS